MNVNERSFRLAGRSAGPAARARGSRGVVLVVTLILLVVIGISSTVAIRSAMVGDQVTNNMRTQNLALQAAELALRYCEDQVLGVTGAVSVKAAGNTGGDNPTDWATLSRWDGTTPQAVSVPTSLLTATASTSTTSISYTRAPQCMVEELRFPQQRGAIPERAFLVTARGFSPDYRRDAGGNAAAGSEVWLQSTVRSTQ
jgi:Tfp pilus assembly protein PilX